MLYMTVESDIAVVSKTVVVSGTAIWSSAVHRKLTLKVCSRRNYVEDDSKSS